MKALSLSCLAIMALASVLLLTVSYVCPHIAEPSSRSGCVIADSALDRLARHDVGILRYFRDRYLQSSESGRWLVRQYYTCSKAATTVVAEHPWLRPVVRVVVWPAARLVDRPIISIGLLVCLIVFVRRRRLMLSGVPARNEPARGAACRTASYT